MDLYKQTSWTDNKTPISAKNMNNIEEGIAQVDNQVRTVASTVAGHNEIIAELQSSITSLGGKVDNKLSETTQSIAGLSTSNYEITQAVATINATVTNMINTDNAVKASISAIGEDINKLEAHIGASKDANGEVIHGLSAEVLNTYEKEAIDNKVNPVKTIEGVTQTQSTFINLVDIGQFPHNLRLDIKSDDHLWTIIKNTKIANSFTSQELLSDKISDLLSTYSWQSISSPLDSTKITASILRTTAALPSSNMPSGSSDIVLEIDGGTSVKAFLDLLSESGQHYFISLGWSDIFYVVLRNNELFVKCNADPDQTIIKNLPENLKIVDIYLSTTSTFDTAATYTGKFESYSLKLSNNKDSNVVNLEDIYQSGSYYADFSPKTEVIQDTYEVSGSLIAPESHQALLEYSISYLKKDSSLSALKLNNLITIEKDGILEEAKNKASQEVQKLLTYGITDPTSKTPGLVYFKYLA